MTKRIEKPIPAHALQIDKAIFVIRNKRIMFDVHLARLYGVSTGRLVEAVKRKENRFPEDFMFQINNEEFAVLKKRHEDFSSEGRGGRRSPPYAFTEQGVAMLSSVLNSERAVEMNIQIMRAFVKLREMVAERNELARKLEKLESRVGTHDKYIRELFLAIRNLMTTPTKSRPIGFGRNDKE